MIDAGYCIYITTICDGPVPIERNERGYPVVYETEIEAQKSIAEDTVERLHQFLADEREFDDAMTVEEYVVPVTVLPDGSVVDEDGGHFASGDW